MLGLVFPSLGKCYKHGGLQCGIRTNAIWRPFVLTRSSSGKRTGSKAHPSTASEMSCWWEYFLKIQYNGRHIVITYVLYIYMGIYTRTKCYHLKNNIGLYSRIHLIPSKSHTFGICIELHIDLLSIFFQHPKLYIKRRRRNRFRLFYSFGNSGGYGRKFIIRYFFLYIHVMFSIWTQYNHDFNIDFFFCGCCSFHKPMSLPIRPKSTIILVKVMLSVLKYIMS